MADTRTCPHGCDTTNPDTCRASGIIDCPLGFWESERTDTSGHFNAACGCLARSRCGGCGGCRTCDGCYCGED